MNDKFDELAKGLAQSVTRRGALKKFGIGIAGIALATLFALPIHATDFKRGPLVQLSTTSPWPGCAPGGFGPGPLTDDVEVEPHFAVNPVNPKNVVAVWAEGRFRGMVAGVSFDGGKRWQQVPIPGLSVCSGGTEFEAAVDEWLAFAPNGDLYLVTGAFNRTHVHGGYVVIKSTDGGLHWGQPTTLISTDDSGTDGLPRITADPFDARVVYVSVTLDRSTGNRAQLLLFRTTDAGASWSAAQETYRVKTSNNELNSPHIVVLPDGTVVSLFTEILFNNDDHSTSVKEAIISLVRSTDRGETWSAPIRAVRQSSFTMQDPDTGHGINNMSSTSFPFFSATGDLYNGNLYLAWEDLSFNGVSAIAFAMSTDGGFTWSVPIPVNQTPTSVAPGNRQALLPSIAVAADGTIGVSYYDFRFNDNSPGLLTDYWLAHCHPSSTTPASDPSSWRSEVRLTDSSFNFETAPDLGGFAPPAVYFLGDYMGLATVGNDFLSVFEQTHDSDHGSVFFRRAGP